ncbi:MAG: nucleotidyltransferase domain-containing protein [Nanoarchaeota archaeon]|nr:nucleotidyltransferase domain-containing protein [Nanoarchaeota archaeon]
MNSKILLQIKTKLKKHLADKEILDIILFGSFTKGSETFNDIDIVFITEKKINLDDEFHLTILSPKDFFVKIPTLINTLLREGYSLKHNKNFSELYGFAPFSLFNYDLSKLTPSTKVKIVNALRGKKNEKGLVEKNSGEWITKNVFKIKSSNDALFEKLFSNFQIKYKKSIILMH